MVFFKNKFIKRIAGVFISVTILLITIGIVIIAQGKKIDDNGQIIETSIIRINSLPSDVKAFINGKEQTITDNEISNLDPGQIDIKLTKDGYTPWEKQVILKSGIVTDIYAQLYPQNIIFQKLTTLQVDKVFYSKDASFVFYTVIDSNDPTQNGIWKLKLNRNLLDFNNTKPLLIANFSQDDITILQKHDYLIKISNDNNKIIFQIPDLSKFYIYDANVNNSKIDLSDKLDLVPSNVEWFRDSGSILVLKDNLLTEVDLDTFQVNLVTYNDSKVNYVQDANTVIYMKNGKIFKYNNKSSNTFTMPAKFSLILGNITEIDSYFAAQNVLVVKSENGLFYLDFNKNYIDLIDDKSNFIKIASNARSLIFEKDGSLFTYNLEETLDGKSYTATIYDLKLKSTDIINIYFSPSARTLMVLMNNNILITMDFDGQNRKQLLKDFKIIDSQTLISNDSTELYALIEEKATLDSNTRSVYKFNLEVK